MQDINVYKGLVRLIFMSLIDKLGKVYFTVGGIIGIFMAGVAVYTLVILLSPRTSVL